MLSFLALVVLALAALAPLSVARPRLGHAGAALLCGLSTLALLAWLAFIATPEILVLPLGVPWVGMQLALDPLSAWFALIWAVCGTLATLGALGLAAHDSPDVARAEKFLPLFLAAMLLTLLAADAFTLLLGFEAMSLASWALVVADHTRAEKREAGKLYLVMAAFAGACLLPALGILAGREGALAFSAMRAAPPEGIAAGAVLALTLLGAGAKAGLFPLHLWLPVAHPAAPAPASALMSGAMTKVALYVMARLLFDLLGSAQPWWWGAPLIALGVASAVMGVLRALLESDIKVILACSTIENVGVIAVGFGLALVFRGNDLGPLAALALGAALLHAMAHAIAKSTLFLVAGQVFSGTGTGRLDRLGGLLSRMPRAGGVALVGALTLAALPPFGLFAPEWLMLQALLAVPRIGNMALSIGIAAAAALLALAAALAAVAFVRLFGIAFLSRPRSPEAEAATDAEGFLRVALPAGAVLCVLVGVLPGLLLDLLDPALRGLLGSGVSRHAGLLAVSPPRLSDSTTALSGLALLVLPALACAGILWALRRHAVPGHRVAPSWDCGFNPSAATAATAQYGGASFAQPLARLLGAALFGWRWRVDMPEPGEARAAKYEASFRDPAAPALAAPVMAGTMAIAARVNAVTGLTVRRYLSLMFAGLVVLLAAVAWLERT